MQKTLRGFCMECFWRVREEYFLHEGSGFLSRSMLSKLGVVFAGESHRRVTPGKKDCMCLVKLIQNSLRRILRDSNVILTIEFLFQSDISTKGVQL